MSLLINVNDKLNDVARVTDDYRRKITRLAKEFDKYDENEDLDEAVEAFIDFVDELADYIKDVKKSLHGFDEYFDTIARDSVV